MVDNKKPSPSFFVFGKDREAAAAAASLHLHVGWWFVSVSPHVLLTVNVGSIT
jgi:hypothetical protein